MQVCKQLDLLHTKRYGRCNKSIIPLECLLRRGIDVVCNMIESVLGVLCAGNWQIVGTGCGPLIDVRGGKDSEKSRLGTNPSFKQLPPEFALFSVQGQVLMISCLNAAEMYGT